MAQSLSSFFRHHCLTTFLVVLMMMAPSLAASAAASAEKVFVPISTDIPQDVSKVHLPPNCQRSTRHPRTMFTFLPNDDDADTKVTISTYPADLITAEKQGSELRLVWNHDIASGASEGGVKIFFPADQLLEVSTAADVHAQILNGFTNIQNLHVSSDSVLYANLANSTSSVPLQLHASSDARATVVSSTGLGSLSVSSDAVVRLMAPEAKEVSLSSDAILEMNGNIITKVDVSSDATLRLDGNLESQARISSDAKVTVYGKVTGHVRISSDGQLHVGEELSGTVDARSDAHVYAPSCATVSTSSDAKCSVDDSITGQVLVDIEIQPFTMTGTEHCGFCTIGDTAVWAITAFLVGSLVACGCFYRKHRQCKKNHREMAMMNVDTLSPSQDLENGAKNDKLEDYGSDDPVAVAYPVGGPLKQLPREQTKESASAVEADAIAYEDNKGKTKTGSMV